MSRKISIVINLDTRKGYLDKNAFCGMGGGGGARSVDFMTHNIINKINFFKGHDIEVIVYVHRREDITMELMCFFNSMLNKGHIHNLCINSHTDMFMGKHIRQYHDTMYLNALMLARGEYIAHFDADTSAFRRDDCSFINKLIGWIESGQYDVISYPTYFSPQEGPDEKPTDADYLWASTRFFFCKRKFIDYGRIVKYFDDLAWIEAHGEKPFRYPNVTENILGFIAGPGRVLYPPKDLDEFMIFCWHTYTLGIIEKLNGMEYSKVKDFIDNECGGIGGACDVNYEAS